MSDLNTKENTMLTYLISNMISSHIAAMIDIYEKENGMQFDLETRNEILEFGEEIVKDYFPSQFPNFTLQEDEVEAFDTMISQIINSFMGMLAIIMRLHMHILKIYDELDNMTDDEE